MAGENEFHAPEVHDMTDMTGKSKNEHRRAILIGYSVSRQLVPIILAGVLSFALFSVLLFGFGFYGYLIALILTGIILFALFFRIKKSMDQRFYKALRDSLAADHGTIYIDGRRVDPPALVMHQPLLLDRDPDEFKDTDVAYVQTPSRSHRWSKRWLNRIPITPAGR